MFISRDIKIAKLVLNGKTLKEVGKKFNISQERVRQVFHRTIRIHYNMWRDLGHSIKEIREHKDILLKALEGK